MCKIFFVLVSLVLSLNQLVQADTVRMSFPTIDRCDSYTESSKVTLYNLCATYKSDQFRGVIDDFSCGNPSYLGSVHLYCRELVDMSFPLVEDTFLKPFGDLSLGICVGQAQQAHRQDLVDLSECLSSIESNEELLSVYGVELDSNQKFSYCLAYNRARPEYRDQVTVNFYKKYARSAEQLVESASIYCSSSDSGMSSIDFHLANGETVNLNMETEIDSMSPFENGCFGRIDPGNDSVQDALLEYNIDRYHPVENRLQTYRTNSSSAGGALLSPLEGRGSNEVEFDYRPFFENIEGSCESTGLCKKSEENPRAIYKTTDGGSNVLIPPLGPETTPRICETISHAAVACWRHHHGQMAMAQAYLALAGGFASVVSPRTVARPITVNRFKRTPPRVTRPPEVPISSITDNNQLVRRLQGTLDDLPSNKGPQVVTLSNNMRSRMNGILEGQGMPYRIPENIPENKVRSLTGHPSGLEWTVRGTGLSGVEGWIKIRIHGPHSGGGITPTSNSATGWIMTVTSKSGRHRVLPNGEWVELTSETTDAVMNNVHIPIFR